MDTSTIQGSEVKVVTKIDLVSAGYFWNKRGWKQEKMDNRELSKIVFITFQF